MFSLFSFTFFILVYFAKTYLTTVSLPFRDVDGVKEYIPKYTSDYFKLPEKNSSNRAN